MLMADARRLVVFGLGIRDYEFYLNTQGAETDQSWGNTAVSLHKGLNCVECLPVVDHSVCVVRK